MTLPTIVQMSAKGGVDNKPCLSLPRSCYPAQAGPSSCCYLGCYYTFPHAISYHLSCVGRVGGRLTASIMQPGTRALCRFAEVRLRHQVSEFELQNIEVVSQFGWSSTLMRNE
jgi:hypothetical protein